MSHYGKIGLKSLPSEARRIWYSRHVEPEPCEPIDIYWPTSTDPELELLQDYARRLLAATPLTEREERAVRLYMMDNCTLREAGMELDVTASLLHKILKRAKRKLLRTAWQLGFTPTRRRRF
jgi:DNA-directed RNA polymerase specialized sigma24 family protein